MKKLWSGASRHLNTPIFFSRRKAMQKTVPETGITFVDKPHNTIYLNVGGCQVTVTCSAKDNQELYDQVKDILVDSFFHSPTPACGNLPAIS